MCLWKWSLFFSRCLLSIAVKIMMGVYLLKCLESFKIGMTFTRIVKYVLPYKKAGEFSLQWLFYTCEMFFLFIHYRYIAISYYFWRGVPKLRED